MGRGGVGLLIAYRNCLFGGLIVELRTGSITVCSRHHTIFIFSFLQVAQYKNNKLKVLVVVGWETRLDCRNSQSGNPSCQSRVKNTAGFKRTLLLNSTIAFKQRTRVKDTKGSPRALRAGFNEATFLSYFSK